MKFRDSELDVVSAFLATSVEGVEAVQRWKKYVTRGATPENDLQHTFSASLLAVLIVEALRKDTPGLKFDAYVVLSCVVLHDMGEAKVDDTHYIDKTAEGDLREANAFASMIGNLEPLLADALLTAYLVQFASPSSRLRQAGAPNGSIATRVQQLSDKFQTEALIFEAIERYGYLLYAYREYHLRGDIEILVQVLRNQRTRLQSLAHALPAFGRHFYTSVLDEKIDHLLRENEGLYPEVSSLTRMPV